MEKKELTITMAQLTKVAGKANMFLTATQLNSVFKRTPDHYVRTRKAKGGGTWDYVSVAYIQRVLNLLFGFDWDFEILKEDFDLGIGQVYVKGRLTVRSNNKEIRKEQFGRCDIKFYKDQKLPDGSRRPLDIGNDLKAASSDALKKCASLLGIASDIYGKDDFYEMRVTVDPKNEGEAALTDKLKHFLANCKTLDEVDFVVDNFTEHRETDITEEQSKIIQATITKLSE